MVVQLNLPIVYPESPPLTLVTQPASTPKQPLRFVDLFAGIGGFHQALSQEGMTCVFASEIDDHARKTYLANHHLAPELFNQDIRTLSPDEVPDHDLLCAGFPCQPFSQAGFKKGFDDAEKSERGNLFFCILDVLEAKRPKAFILENVRHLLNHDDGKTFALIHQHLTDLGYVVHYKVLKASDYGRPQHRPRIYIVGFDQAQVDTTYAFRFPDPIPLKTTLNEVWEGQCDRSIGFTLRVGGRGSGLDDRRNWDTYLVDGEVKRLGVKQGVRMMGFPDSFNFPVTPTQAMKQLGNSVCVDVVQAIGQQVKQYLAKYTVEEADMAGKNKGEWSELLPLVSLILNPTLYWGNEQGQATEECVTVVKLAYPCANQPLVYVFEQGEVMLQNDQGETLRQFTLSELPQVKTLVSAITQGQGAAFQSAVMAELVTTLGLTTFKGTSYQKADMLLSFLANRQAYNDEPISVKSHVGGLPTLLNASSATNFIFKVEGLHSTHADTLQRVNSISTATQKVQNRLRQLSAEGGHLVFDRCENPVYEANLRKIDTLMPELLAKVLLKYYQGEGCALTALVTTEQEQCRFKDYCRAVLLGMFPAKAWDGNISANGALVIDKQGDSVLYHVIKESYLKQYLFTHVKLDTPSTTRHRFGTLYAEEDGYYFKLNLQLRLLP
jgi:DNA (cytosine-5)-methyltransferase 1